MKVERNTVLKRNHQISVQFARQSAGISCTDSDVSTPLPLQTQRLDGVAMPKLDSSDPVKQNWSVLYIGP